MSIEVQNVTKRYGKAPALENVSVTIGGQQIFGLLGNNGAGKTTLLNIITDRLLPGEGQVLVDGERSSGNDRALGKLFLMSEQNMFSDELRVGAAFDVTALFYPNFDRAYADSLAQRFGLNTKKKITALSTGYGSIFRLILGLSVGAPYVLYDEPVLGLDAQHRDLFYRQLLERFSEKPATVLISTHLISEVADIVGHTIIIRDGRILKDAPTEELTGSAYTVSGPAALVDQYLAGRNVMSVSSLGGLKTAGLQGVPEAVPQGLEVGRLGLQDYFINLMNQEDRR